MLHVLRLHSDVKASVVNRVAAKTIDMALVMVLGAALPYPLGPFLGFIYSLTCDGLHWNNWKGQSVGKKVLRLKVVHSQTQQPCSYRESAIRNAPVGVATFFGIIPVWGWFILAIIGLPLMIMEVYLMLSAEAGHRLGDVMGETEVVALQKSQKG